MAGCVLRIDGSFTEPDAPEEFGLLDVVLRPWGDGVLEVSDADDLAAQCSAAETFLANNILLLRSLSKNLGVKGLALDFGLWQKPVAAQFLNFPASLVTAAGELGLGLSASLYACSDDEA